MSKLVSSSAQLMENMLDYYSEKNRVASRNIANIGTDGYKRQDVKFKDEFNGSLTNLMKSTDPRHFKLNTEGQPATERTEMLEVTEDQSEEKISGVNNVDIDKEMADLASNGIKFKLAAKRTNSYYRSLQNVIKGGGIA